MIRTLPLVVAAAAALAGCRSIAVKAAADAFAGSTQGSAWTSEDDPELVREAIPFGLKTMETLLAKEPDHQGLLGSLASGFTQYAYAFVLADAEAAEMEGRSSAARVLRERAKRLFLRARDYGLRGLELRHGGLREKLLAVRGAEGAVEVLEKRDVPMAYWTAASWALAISAAKEDVALVAELPVPGVLVARALELDERWNGGALHEFLVSYEGARGDRRSAEEHYRKALALGDDEKLGVHVTYAEAVLVPAQERDAFTKLLEQVLAADVNSSAENRLANVLAQRRARTLLAHTDDLFI